MPNEHGVTRVATLAQFEQRSGQRHPDLDGPPLDPALLYLTRWWRELDGARSAGFNGPNPLSWSEIESWARLTGRRPSAYEAAVLRRIDDGYLRMSSAEAAKRREIDRGKSRTKGRRQ